MISNEIYNIDSVFGVSRGVPLTYVHREVDELFLASLKMQKHIILFSCSKQGKTSLIKKHLDKKGYIAINCEKTKTLNDIYSTLLKEASFEIEVQNEESIQSGNKINIGFKVLSFIGLSSDIESKAQTTSQKKKLEFDISNVHDVIKALESVNFNKYLVIEDFHYLDEKVQEAFAFQLKIFNERSDLLFIILAVWPSEDRFSRFNGDLTGRLSNINANHWSKEDLLKVIETGERLLNIQISEGTKEIIVESSFGSVAVLQMLCLEFCKSNGILRTQNNICNLPISVHVTKILSKWIDSQNARFNSFLRRISETSDSKHQLYKLIILCVIVTDAESLIDGIHLKEVFALINIFQQSEKFTLLELENALLQLKRVQIENNILPCLFEYDDEERILHITDKFLFFWLNNKNRFTSMEELGVEAELILRYRLNRY